jgi:hypothetical protein
MSFDLSFGERVRNHLIAVGLLPIQFWFCQQMALTYEPLPSSW